MKEIIDRLKNTYLKDRFFFIFLFCWIIIFLGIRTIQHFSFWTNACDLSLIDYGMHYTLKGEVMSDPFHKFAFGRWYTQNGELKFEPIYSKSWENHFCIHFTPIIFFIVPFYLIFEGPLFLLYLQVLLVGLSAVPLYFIAKSVFKQKYTPILIVFVYLFFRHLLIGLMYDFHSEMFLPLFLLASYYFIAVKKRRFLYFFFITLALFVKEDIAIYIFFFGIFLFFKFKERRYGLATSIYAVCYFLLTIGLIIPYFRSLEGLEGTYGFLYRWSHLGENFIQIIRNIIVHPGLIFKGIPIGLFLRKISNIVSPLLLIPFFCTHILLVLPPLLVAILSKAPQMYTFGIHYSAVLLPFIFLSLTYGLKNIADFFEKQRKIKFKKVLLVILILLLLINLTNSNFWRIIRPSRYRALGDYKQVKQIIKQLPPDASVSALSSIIPHIPKRKTIYMLPEVDEAEYIIIHSGINLWPYKKEEFQNFLKRIEKEKKYKILFQKGEIMLFKRDR